MKTINELTQLMDTFVREKGWYQPDSPRRQTPRSISISLALEASEVLELFQWSEDPRPADDLPGELADVALYLLQLANLTGIDLEQAVLAKLKANASRTWAESEVK